MYKGSSFQSVGQADVNDLSPSVFLNLELGLLSNKPLFGWRLYL